MKRTIFLLFITIMLFSSCSLKQDELTVEPIFIDFNNIKTLDLSEAMKIELETKNASLLHSLDYIQFIDDKLYIQSRDQIKAFDKNNGNYLFNVGTKGRGPGEYTNFSNFYIQGDKLYIVDALERRIFSYDEKGTYLSSIEYYRNREKDLMPEKIFPLKNGKYISKNMFMGANSETPVASILDEDFDHLKAIQGRNLKTGITVVDLFCEHNGDILYWEVLNDTIYNIDNSGQINPRYFVDFNKHALPRSVSTKDVYDKIEFVNIPENAKKIASLVKYVQHDENFVRFIFAFDNNVYYVRYNKKNKTTNTYWISDSRQLYEPLFFMHYKADQVYFFASLISNTANNPAIFVFNDVK